MIGSWLKRQANTKVPSHFSTQGVAVPKSVSKKVVSTQVSFELNPLNATMRSAMRSGLFAKSFRKAAPLMVASAALCGPGVWTADGGAWAAASVEVKAPVFTEGEFTQDTTNFSTATFNATTSDLVLVTNSAASWTGQWLNLSAPIAGATIVNVTTSINNHPDESNRSASGIQISGGDNDDTSGMDESVTINIAVNTTVKGSAQAILITPSTDLELVTINNNGTLSGSSSNVAVATAGVYTSAGQQALLGLTINNQEKGSISSLVGDGIKVAGVAGTVTVDNNGSISANSTTNLNVAAVSVSSSTAVSITNRASKTISSGNDGIRITGIANSVLITNEAGATISGISASGTKEGYGVRISTNWDTDVSNNDPAVNKTVSILNSGTISGDVAGVLIDGVGKSEDEQAGNATVYVNNSGLITGRSALRIQNVFESTGLNNISTGDVKVVNSGNLSGTSGPGLFIDNIDGYVDVNVTSTGRIEGYAIQSGDGTALKISDVGDYVKITNDGTIVGQQNNASASALAIDISGAARTVTIENQSGGSIYRSVNGTIPTDSRVIAVDQSDNATGNVSLSNAGNITGTIYLTSQNDSVRFDNTGTWKVSGDAFTANTDQGKSIVISNSGRLEIFANTTIGVSPGNVLTSFENNNGTIDLTVNSSSASSPRISVLTINTETFQGAVSGGASGPSKIVVDANLTGTVSSSSALVSDRVSISGKATGVTQVQIVDSASSIAGSHSAVGIEVVRTGDSTSESKAFELSGGPINKGLWQYDLFSTTEDVTDGEDTTTTTRVWRLASTPSEHAHELPVLQSAAQEAWHQSAAAWLDHTNNIRMRLDGGNAVKGGAWARVVGADVKRTNTNRYTQPASPYGNTISQQNDYNQDIYGVMFGADGAIDLANGGTWLLGLTGGVVQSKVGFTTSTTTMDYTAGSVGAYASYVQGGGFFNALLKGDIGSTDYKMSNGEGISANESFKTNAIGLMLDGGYRFRSGIAFIEPSLSVAAVNTNVKDKEFLATKVDFSNGNSLRTKLTLATGFSGSIGGTRWEPSLSLSAVNESGGENDVNLTSGGQDPVKVQDRQVKTYGQVGLGLKVIGAKGSSGFLMVEHAPSRSDNDATKGDAKRESTTVSAGVKVTW